VVCSSGSVTTFSAGTTGFTPSSPTAGAVVLAGNLNLTSVATQATNTIVGNATSGTASPTALAIGSCSSASSALIWTTNTGFGCNTSITANAVAIGGITGLGTGVATFLATPSATNLNSALTGGTLAYLGSAQIFTAVQTINLNAASLPAGPVGTALQVGQANAGVNYFVQDAFGSLNALYSRRANGTNASKTALLTNDIILDIIANGYGATAYSAASAVVVFQATENWSDTAQGSQVLMQVTPNGTATRATVASFTGSTFSLPGSIQLNVAAMTQTAAAQSGTVCYNSGTGAVTYDGSLGCLTSLEETKEIHGPILGALDTVAALRTFWFSPINRPKGSDLNEQPGFGAHQVESVDRRLVGYGENGELRGVRYMEMTAVLTAAIQELKIEVDILKARR